MWHRIGMVSPTCADRALTRLASLPLPQASGSESAGSPGASTGRLNPSAFAGGRVLVAGDASVTYGSEDPGWFTYTNYETSAIRRLRAGVTVEARATKRIAFLAEIRAETGVGVTPYAWYIRVSPLDSGLLDIQAGRGPARLRGVFTPQLSPGQSVDRIAANLSVPDDGPPGCLVPATAVELLESKGSGWLVDYSVGNPSLTTVFRSWRPSGGTPACRFESARRRSRRRSPTRQARSRRRR